jgi:hypothetical protein
MRRLTLTIAAVVAATVIGGGVYASTSSGSCNYTEKGDYINSRMGRRNQKVRRRTEAENQGKDRGP